MLQSKELIKDLGSIKFGKPHIFTFTVKATTPCEITKLVVGCGSCTKATINKTKLQPEENIDINVIFTPGSTGKQTKHITVRYDADSVLKLEFTADVYP